MSAGAHSFGLIIQSYSVENRFRPRVFLPLIRTVSAYLVGRYSFKLAQKVWYGDFVDMVELLPQSLSAVMRDEHGSSSEVQAHVYLMGGVHITMKSPERVPDVLVYL